MKRAAILLVVCGSLVASTADAQAVDRPRVFGAGFSLGLGFQGWNSYDHGLGYRPAGLAGSLGPLELMAFVDDHFSIDLTLLTWLPIMDAIVTSAGAYTATVYFDWSFGDRTRFVVGPGLGVSGHTSSLTASAVSLEGAGGAQLRIAGLLGFEVLSASRLFGFRLVTRPWLSLGGGEAGFQVGGGALLESILMFYAL